MRSLFIFVSTVVLVVTEKKKQEVVDTIDLTVANAVVSEDEENKKYSVLSPSLCMTTLSLKKIWFTTIPYHKMSLCMLFTASKPGYVLKQLQSMRRTRPTHTSSISL
ncbi:hypothetical protein EDC94DRAFT_153332 [Helicostylum pulchrum]|nr:hypothetical protein EDC94DRAFT_153332 [Helicostylum pulchrum]